MRRPTDSDVPTTTRDLPIKETLVAFVMLLLMVGSTIFGAAATNERTGAYIKAKNAERVRIAMELGIDSRTIEVGRDIYMTTCISCHGPNGEAMPGLGKDLAHSDFIKTKSDSEMLMFIKSGRGSWDPLNTTGIDMPPKGGNPTLTDDDIKKIVAYLRYLTVAASSS